MAGVELAAEVVEVVDDAVVGGVELEPPPPLDLLPQAARTIAIAATPAIAALVRTARKMIIPFDSDSAVKQVSGYR
ncbi:hypothetical protein [Jatrophihabitans sp.]|uniref:hypothetical protein n=1 Tax=Jatrophihabitans sp. TaxID=1932789 RepID=UPI0030C70D04